MQEVKVTCDKCKAVKVANSVYETGYHKVTLTLGTDIYSSNKKAYELCPECLKKYGLVDEDGKDKSVKEPDIAEQLFNIIQEAVQEAREG